MTTAQGRVLFRESAREPFRPVPVEALASLPVAFSPDGHYQASCPPPLPHLSLSPFPTHFAHLILRALSALNTLCPRHKCLLAPSPSRNSWRCPSSFLRMETIGNVWPTSTPLTHTSEPFRPVPSFASLPVEFSPDGHYQASCPPPPCSIHDSDNVRNLASPPRSPRYSTPPLSL